MAGLCAALGFSERLRIADHRAQLTFPGGGALGVTDGGGTAAAGYPCHRIMVRVPDVEAYHRRAVGYGAKVLSPPTDYPFGERQYSLEDPAGHLRVFSQSLADVDPASWGGTLLGN